MIDIASNMEREHARRAKLGLQPLSQVEAANQAQYEDLTTSVFTKSGDRYVVAELDRRHADYMKALAPRLKTLTDRARDFHSAMARARSDLTRNYHQLPAAEREKLDERVATLDAAEATVRDQSRTLTRKLAAVLRRGRIQRLALEGAHAVILLLVFTVGFGKIGEWACRWVAEALGRPPLDDGTCVLIWAIVTILLFALERWFLGPGIDHLVEERIEGSAAETVGRYYVERVRLEYDLDYLDHVTGEVHGQLMALGLIPPAP